MSPHRQGAPRSRRGSVHVVDSHTEGEPTRVFLAIPSGDDDAIPAKIECRSRSIRQWMDVWRRPDGSWRPPNELLALVTEPRAAAATVGALRCAAASPGATCGVLFFNSAGSLGMCGHGTIGLAETLRWLGEVDAGDHRFETPVGDVAVRIAGDGRVEVANVAAHRLLAGVDVDVDGRLVRGDVAWGGNWFFIVDVDEPLRLSDADALLARTRAILGALSRSAVRGAGGALIDHVALFGRPGSAECHSRNFVLCPNGSFDRSPCGTGTSAKLACLAADGRLAPGETWRQESITGSRFDAWYGSGADGLIRPSIRGRAWITGEARLVIDPDDPSLAAARHEA